MATPADENRRCTANAAATGERCQKAAILGHHVCDTHGGRAPQVKRKAQETLEAAHQELLRLVLPAISILEELLEAGPDATRLSAVKDILDRSGLSAIRRSESKVSVSQTSDLDSEISELLAALKAKDDSVGAPSLVEPGTAADSPASRTLAGDCPAAPGPVDS